MQEEDRRTQCNIYQHETEGKDKTFGKGKRKTTCVQLKFVDTIWMDMRANGTEVGDVSI